MRMINELQYIINGLNKDINDFKKLIYKYRKYTTKLNEYTERITKDISDNEDISEILEIEFKGIKKKLTLKLTPVLDLTKKYGYLRILYEYNHKTVSTGYVSDFNKCESLIKEFIEYE